MIKKVFAGSLVDIFSFFKDLGKPNPVYSKVLISTFLICILPGLISLAGVNFGSYYNLKELNLLTNISTESEAFRILDRIEKGNFLHTILETFCGIVAIFTVVFAFIIYEVKKDIITTVIGTTLFCAGLLDAFHILATDQLIWSPDKVDVTVFTWLVSRFFNSGIILFSSLIILSDSNLFDKIVERSVAQLVFFFILITVLTILILFFNVNQLPNIILEKSLIKRPLELIPLIIFVINLVVILPIFYKKNPSVFSFSLLISMIPAAATQVYMSFSISRFDSNFNIAHLIKALSYLIPFIGILIDYLHTYKKQTLLVEELNRESAEKAKTQALLSGVLDSSIDGIIALKAIRNEHGGITDFEITLANDAVEKLLGFNKKDLVGKKSSQTLIEDRVLFEKYATVTETGQNLSFEYFYSNKGKAYWFSTVVVKLRDGVAITLKDITSIRKAQEEIDHYQKKLESKIEELNRSNMELEQFAYVASHDLQEPLRKIQAFGDRLVTKYSSSLQEEGNDYISRMKNAASRMQLLINDLLNFSRVKRSNNNFEKINLNSLTSEVLSDLETRIDYLNAKVQIGDLPIIEGDKRQLGQLFQNLISNALKFHKKNIAPEIKIGAKKVVSGQNSPYHLPSDKTFFEISIEDNGIGFDNKYLDKIFTIFQRLHGRNEYEGTGIGLAICRKVVENHHGIITAESKINLGTIFFVVLPEKQ